MTVAPLDTSNLLPCPFCGDVPTGRVYALMAVVWCTGCGADMPGGTPDVARIAWNRRVNSEDRSSFVQAVPIAATADIALSLTPTTGGHP